MNENQYFESKDKSLGIQISNQLIQKLHNICKNAYPYETGGILIGRYSEDLKWAQIMTVSETLAKSNRSHISFTRNGQGVTLILKKYWEEKQYYLGEWHYHPGASPLPSELDKKTMFMLSRSKKLYCPEPILFVVGGNADKWNHYAGVYKRSEEIVLKEVKKAL